MLQADEETLFMARDPERISIKEILDCVRGYGEKKRKQPDGTEADVGIEELLQEVDSSVTKTLEGKSLQSLIVAHGPPSP
jgi:DNA-binding IscR family transcriptional regulator